MTRCRSSECGPSGAAGVVRGTIVDDNEEVNAGYRAARAHGGRDGASDVVCSDDGGDAYSLIQQYMDGQIDASRLMKEIDRKVRMRIMEGA